MNDSLQDTITNKNILDIPNGSDLLMKAIQENFNHARHQELLRDRFLTLYWVLWASILAYIGRKGEFSINIDMNWYMFFYLFIISVSTLKWNAEFGNHIAAIAAIAKVLGLNFSTSLQNHKPNPPLPFQEFTGYIALPLRFPIQLSVSSWISVVLCISIGISFSLSLYGFLKLHSNCSKLWIPIISGLIISFLCLIICKYVYNRMHIELKTRILKSRKQ